MNSLNLPQSSNVIDLSQDNVGASSIKFPQILSATPSTQTTLTPPELSLTTTRLSAAPIYKPNSYTDYLKTLQILMKEKEEDLLKGSAKRDLTITERIEAEMRSNKTTPPNDWDSDLEEMDIDSPLLQGRRQPLTSEERNKVERILRGPHTDEVIIDKFNIEMTRNHFICLSPGTWLNDEVINFYMSILMERDEQMVQKKQKQRTSHYFNSFFFTKLLENGQYNYSNIKRWTRKFNIFEKEKIIIPVNLHNTHWTLLVIYMQKKEIHYYDSMSGSGTVYLNAAERWIIDEGREKYSMTIDKSEWKKFSQENHVPQQRNGFDCGMFTIMCADYISDDLPLTYSQAEMSEYRLKVGAAILRGGLTY